MKKIYRLLRSTRTQMMFLIGLVFFVYANSLGNGFVSDDIKGIVEASKTWTLASSIHWPRAIHLGVFFQYITIALFGPVPWVLRLINICFHAGSVITLFCIVKRLWNVRTACIAGAFFAVHPLLVESVTWISGGVYAQYSFLFLLSLFFFVKIDDSMIKVEIKDRSVKTDKRSCRSSIFSHLHDPSTVYYLVSIFFYILALLFSEKAIPLALLFFIYEYVRGNLKKEWEKLIPYFIASIIMILFYATKILTHLDTIGASTGEIAQGLYNPLLQIPIAITEYLRLFFWPVGLTLYHATFVFTPISFAIRLSLCLGLGVVCLWSIWRNKRLFFLFSFAGISLLVVLSPVKIAWVVAERYAYLSAAAMCTFVAWGIDTVIQRLMRNDESKNKSSRLIKLSKFLSHPARPKNIIAFPACRQAGAFCILFLVPLSLLSYRTILRNYDWYSEDTLWQADLLVSPESVNVQNNIGDFYSRHGRYEDAIAAFIKATQIDHRYSPAYHNLGMTYLFVKQPALARSAFQTALSINPNLWQSRLQLAAIAFEEKNYDAACDELEKARRIDPTNAIIVKNIARVEQILGDERCE